MATHTLLPVEVGSRRLLLDAHQVYEIIGSVETVDVPLASSELPGVFLWSGQALPLVMLAKCLKLDEDAEPVDSTYARTLVVKNSGELLGLRVDKVGEVMTVAAEQLGEIRVFELPFAKAELEFGDQIHTLIDLSAVVAHVMHQSGNRTT